MIVLCLGFVCVYDVPEQQGQMGLQHHLHRQIVGMMMASYPNFASFVTGGTGHCTGAFSEASLNPEFLPWLNTVMAWNQSMG
jgi:hypothetical protein